MTRSIFILAIVLAVAAPSLESSAIGDELAAVQAKNFYDRAETAYALGKFEEALGLYEQAYQAKGLAAFLFNIGQCHRNLGHWERAAFFYQGFLSKEPKAKNRPAVLALVDQMNQKMREEKEANAQKPPDSTIRVTPAVPPQTTVVAPQTTQVTPAVPVSNPNSVPLLPPPVDKPVPVYKKWWLWTAVGVVVAAGAGVAIGVVATHPSVDPSNLTNGNTLKFSPTGPIDATH